MSGVRVSPLRPLTSAGGTAATAGGCNPLTRKHAGSSPALPTNMDGYRNGYNGAVLKTEVAKALWVRILHHPPIVIRDPPLRGPPCKKYAPVSQFGRGNGLRHHLVQVRVLSGAPIYLVRLTQRTRSYGLRNAGWIPARDTMILSSNW